MPLYDFKCEKCDYIEEVLTSSTGSSEIILTCPECEEETMKRQVGLSSFQLKGGGWYKDGYTKKPK
jgi:putative FmdB family regulatory protein